MCGGGWLHAKVLCGWKDRCGVSAVHGGGNGEHEVNRQSYLLFVCFLKKLPLIFPHKIHEQNCKYDIYPGAGRPDVHLWVHTEVVVLVMQAMCLSVFDNPFQEILHPQSQLSKRHSHCQIKTCPILCLRFESSHHGMRHLIQCAMLSYIHARSNQLTSIYMKRRKC